MFSELRTESNSGSKSFFKGLENTECLVVDITSHGAKKAIHSAVVTSIYISIMVHHSSRTGIILSNVDIFSAVPQSAF